jgi:hypothetical protein
MPSAADPTMFDTIMPLIVGPRYSEGLVTTVLAPTAPGALTLEQSPITWEWDRAKAAWVAQPNSPTSWAWNIRLGDRLTVGGHPYIVCGPIVIGSDGKADNADLFVHDNLTLPKTFTDPDGVTHVTLTVEYLHLVNGRDDDHDGYIDNGWDGLDNDLVNGPDDAAEWETEAWTGPAVTNAPYSVIRRPIPGKPQSIVTLGVPVSLAIDPETGKPLSTLPVNPLSGAVDLMINPNGTVDLSGPYAAPSAVGLAQARSVFVLADPDGNKRSLILWTRTGRVEVD